MSSTGELELPGHPDTTLQHSSKSSISLIEARSVPISSANLQPSNDTDLKAVEPISIEGEEIQPDSGYIHGYKLHILTLGLWIALFLSTIETTIVSTALVSITDALHGFDSRDWIVTSYLLTYTGFLVIYAKFSDVFGRKTMILLALALFTIFSVACGVAKSMVSLIILRAFQGMGASGIYSMVLVIAPTLVPREKFGKYMAIVSSVFAIASILGPILGGAITTHSTWRWVFLLNAPGGAAAIVIIAFYLPSTSLPSGQKTMKAQLCSNFSKAPLSRIDTLGVIFLLTASVLLVFALEEAGQRYPWSSAVIVSTITLSGICWIAFVGWEYFIEKSRSPQEPIFPMRLLKDRVLVGMMSTAFFVGFPFVSIVVNIPQRAQAVNGLSPVRAGIALLPLLLTSPFATAVQGVLTSNFKVPPFYLMLIGAVLQLIGVGLTSSLPTNRLIVAPQQYGYEVIMGLGFGLSLSTVLTLAPLVVKEADLPVTMGALTQVRVLGGTIGLAICSTILNDYAKSNLRGIITPAQLLEISDSLTTIEMLTPEQRAAVRTTFAEGYNKQMRIMTVFSGAAVLTTLLVWERKPRRAE